MTRLQRAWHFWLGEPFWWIFLTFFQPKRFEREFETRYPHRLQRFGPSLRLIIPMILLMVPVALLGRAVLVALHLVPPDISVFLFNITLGIAGGIAVGIAFGIAVGIAGGIAVGIAGGIAGGIAFGIAFGIAVGIAFGIAGGIAGGIAVGIAGGIAGGIAVGIAGGIAFIAGFFRLPFYLIDGPSLLIAYRASRRQPSQIVRYLHRSALYWDELVYLPLPFLKQTLLIAYDESPVKALEEMAFIVAERPQQMRAARAAALEIALRDLERRTDLATMAEALDRLAEVLPATTKLTDPRWATPVARLSDASRDAARAISPIGLQGRRKALENLQANLVKVHPNVAFRNQRLNARLVRVVETWSVVAQAELALLSKAAQDIGNLDNPYKPGQILSLKDTLFHGRHDLAKELEGALSLGSSRPTFLLNGERRMGKTSVLQQLPYVLGSTYISVFYNLQQPGLYASTTTFLGALATGMQLALESRGIPVEKLAYETRRDDNRSYDARVYRAFERWLAGVEAVLEREERTLLLAFDEFEMLEEIEQAQHMEVRPLLNWMRSVIQFHPRIALLFSGVKTFDEMGTQGGIDWTGYFINVQMLRVSFLKPAEARHLILKPTPAYPGADIFPEEVVGMILVETGCHPFLLQAVCSALITLLNVERRELATLDDVTQAGARVLSDWAGHFTHLWNRTDEQQRACLEALLAQPHADIVWLAEHTSLDVKVARRTMQHLLRRDLVVSASGETYGLAVPMFRRWLENR